MGEEKKSEREKRDKMCEQKSQLYQYTLPLYFCIFSLCKMAKSTNKLFCASCLFAGD